MEISLYFELSISFITKNKSTELHRPLRSRFGQAGAPGSVQGENAGEDDREGADGEGGAGEELPVLLPGVRQAQPSRAAGQQHQLQIQREHCLFLIKDC